MRRPAFVAIALALALCATAAARLPDGTLGLIETPNNGVCAIAAPGGYFDVVVKERAELKLAGSQEAAPLEIEWADLPGGKARARCRVAEGTPPGTYALEASAGGIADRNERAVYVRKDFPEYYVVAHLTDTHIGSDRHARAASDIFRDAIRAVNETDAAFALISGDLTESGSMEQFREFLAVLDGCAIPTLVCPGNHDRDGLNYEKVFGPLTYGFLFGLDGYIVYDTKDFVTADDLDRQNADLDVLRRATKQCRWTIGVTHRFEPAQSMRSQLILFVDNPLDHLMFGHWHRARETDPKQVPWKTTPMTMTPATVDGFLRLYDISAKEIRPRDPQRVAEVGPPAAPPETPDAATPKSQEKM